MANVLPASSLGIIKEYIDKGDNTLMADIIEQGYAIDNLKAMTEGKTHNTYTQTTENGTKTLTSSAEVAPYAEVNKVLGKSLCWRQLLENGDFSNGTTGWIKSSYTVSNDSDGVHLVLPSSASTCQMHKSISSIANHVYLYSRRLKASANGVKCWVRQENNQYEELTLTTSYVTYNRIGADTRTNIEANIVCGSYINNDSDWGQTISCEFFELFDLTEIFGSGNEPSSVSDPRMASLSQNNLNKIISLKGAIKVQGKLEYDESNPTVILPNEKVKAIKINSLVVTNGSDNNSFIWFDGYSDNFLFSQQGKRYVNGSSVVRLAQDGITVTKNGVAYVGTSGVNSPCAIGDVFVLSSPLLTKSTTNIDDGVKKVQSPYTITLKDSITLQGVGFARDEYCPETGKITRKFIQKLMTSLNWNGSNGNYSTLVSDMSNRNGYNLTPMICEIYPIGASAYDCTIRNNSRYIAVYDSSCPSLESFIAKITGKYIGYEKAEYTEEADEACNRFLKVEKGGTITVSSNESYGDAEITYQTQITSTT